MSKTPYEIRLELLQMAKDHLDKSQAAQIEFAKDAFYKAAELGQITIAQANEQIRAMIPAPYAMDEMVKKASELYAFIMKKD
jgi:hypothetical protein